MADQVNMPPKEAKVVDDAVSSAEGQVHTAFDRLPPSLAGLSDEERQRLNKKLVRKLDYTILPIVGVLYILNYIDRQNLGAAKLQGITTDLGITTTQFATAVSILFVGYLPFQIPSSLAITRIARPGMYICVAVTIWGAISAATAAVNTYAQLLGVRVILGVVEERELGKRFAALYIAQQVGNAFGGLFAAAVLQLDGQQLRGRLALTGSATVFIGAICAFFMPEFPHNSHMLSPLQHDLAVWRIESEAGAAEGSEDETVLAGFRKALTDPKLLLMILCNMLSQAQGSIANYFPTLVDSLGYNSTISLLLTAPPYILAGFVYYGLMFYSDRRNTVYWPIVALICTAIAMYVILLATVNTGAHYFAIMILPGREGTRTRTRERKEVGNQSPVVKRLVFKD
ncbi:hypothetical protein SCUCBS95973_006271 [Sporothrix curviconia]|uniref:Major facilitator superfamily transporter n=1 Tax=Sporothrix curviconia TaxID=1260050 RepID=A0ABP0C677_9PEZI